MSGMKRVPFDQDTFGKLIEDSNKPTKSHIIVTSGEFLLEDKFLRLPFRKLVHSVKYYKIKFYFYTARVFY
jgi:hypothetical protein